LSNLPFFSNFRKVCANPLLGSDIGGRGLWCIGRRKDSEVLANANFAGFYSRKPRELKPTTTAAN
jgi:hypothetical protein